MIYFLIFIFSSLLGIYFLFKIYNKKSIRYYNLRLKTSCEISYIIRVLKSCENYKQLALLGKWWRNYMKLNPFYKLNKSQYFTDLGRIDAIVETKTIEFIENRKNLNKITKLSKQQIDILKAKVENEDHTHIRKGQMYFNELYKINPQLADSIRSSSFDPFYDDDKIERFLNKISE